MRPRKTTIDFFPHRTTSGRTIFILENLYGNNGYAAWFKILELLGTSQGHYYDFSNPANFQYLAARMGVSAPETTAILNTLSELDAIDPELHAQGIIWSQNFVDGLEGVYAKRGSGLPEKPCLRNRNTSTAQVSAPETPVSDTEMQQRKGKESKGEESREKKKITPKISLDHLDPVFKREVVQAFIDHRTKLKKPLTQYALNLACNDAIKCRDLYGIDPNEALERVIANGWQGCNPKYFEPRESRNGGKPRAYSVKDALTIQNEEIARALNEDERRKQQQRIDPDGRENGSLLLEHSLPGSGVCQ